jgi:hypothetical protein
MDKSISDLKLHEELVVLHPGPDGPISKSITAFKVPGGIIYTTRSVVTMKDSVSNAESSVFVPYEKPKDKKTPVPQ